MKAARKILSVAVTFGALTLFIQGWGAPHWLTMVGAILLAARPTKAWKLPHWYTFLGAAALGGLSMWLKYGGPDFQINDTPVLGLILMVLRAMYQTPPNEGVT